MAKIKFAMPTRLLLVEWLDAVSGDHAGWKSWKATHRQAPCLVHSVGYVIRDEPDYITLAGSVIVEDGTNDGEVTIPRPMVQKITELEPKT